MTEGVTTMWLRSSQPELGSRFTAAALHEMQRGLSVCTSRQRNVKSSAHTSKMECLCCRTRCDRIAHALSFLSSVRS